GSSPVHSVFYNNAKMVQLVIIILVIGALTSLVLAAIPILSAIFVYVIVPFLLLKGLFHIYEYFYYKSSKFNEISYSIKKYTKSCNELNEHIEELKSTYLNIKRIDYGNSDYTDTSQYNFKRPELKKVWE